VRPCARNRHNRLFLRFVVKFKARNFAPPKT
jgi:hypothetical protein